MKKESEQTQERKFAVFIDGKNFLLTMEGKEQALGFFVTKRVYAENDQQAADMALAAVRNDSIFISAYKQAHISNPTVAAKLVKEITDVGAMEDSGYTFYPMND